MRIWKCKDCAKKEERILMKKRILCMVLAGVMLVGTVCAINNYTVEAPPAGIFGTPTSVITTVVGDNVNEAAVDKSKNSALIPPEFGSPTSNLRNSGEPLTPNLASPYVDAVTGTTIVGNTSASGVTVTTTTQNTIVNTVPGTVYEGSGGYYPGESFTAVMSSMYYSGGHIATLKIPTIGVNVKVYEGTTDSVLSKGVGHFKDTSIWNGNVCIAGHNRGVNSYFGEIHELDYGDAIKLTTRKGTRTYEVFSVRKISVNDTSSLQGTYENIITLITCVKNQSDYYRWCVQAREI